MTAKELQKFELKTRINKLTIKAFRGFENEISIDFDKNLTVLIGVNGSGKTTLLDAIAGLLIFVPEQLLGKGSDTSEFFNSMDINNTKKNLTSNIELSLWLDYPILEIEVEQGEKIKEDWRLIENYRFDRKYKITPKSHDEVIIDEYSDEDFIDGNMNFTATLKTSFGEWLSISNNVALPIFAYYTIGRIDRKSNTSQNNFAENDILSNYKRNELSKNSFNFETLQKWFALEKILTLTKKDRNTQAKSKDKKILEQVEEAILKMINDEKNTYSKIDVEWNEHTPEGELVFKKGKSLLRYSQMSSGEKTMIALVADLARQITIANPNATKPLEIGTGIVLIDEIDLHLHPRWQRRIVVTLRELFPKIQFIITTHSPLLISTIDKKHVRIIKNNKIQNSPYTKGRDLNAVITEVFDEPKRSLEYEKKLSDFYDLLETNIDKAKNLLEELKNDFGDNDSEIIRAESYIEIY